MKNALREGWRPAEAPLEEYPETGWATGGIARDTSRARPVDQTILDEGPQTRYATSAGEPEGPHPPLFDVGAREQELLPARCQRRDP